MYIHLYVLCAQIVSERGDEAFAVREELSSREQPVRVRYIVFVCCYIRARGLVLVFVFWRAHERLPDSLPTH